MKLVTGLLLLTSVGVAWSQAPVPAEILALRKSFDDKGAAELTTLRTSIMAPVERRYLDALNRSLKGVQQSGNLEETKLFQAEIQQLEAFQASPGAMITALVPNPPPVFGKLRDIYLNEAGKFESEVFRKMGPLQRVQEQALTDLAARLTRQGNLADAEAALQEKKRVYLARCRIPDGTLKLLANGQPCYTNRDYVWQQLSEGLQNLTFNMTTGGVRKTCTVHVLRPGVLYVGCLKEGGDESEKQLLALGFKKTKESFMQTPRGGSGMMVLSKFVAHGFTLPEAINSFSGFIVIGNLEN